MDARLVELAGLLRHHGVRVGPGEVIDAARALAAVGLEEKEIARAALRTCLVKRAADVPLFDRLFEQYFAGAAEPVDVLEGALLEELELSGVLDEQELAALRAMIGGLARPLAAVLQGDQASLARELGAASLALDLGALESAMQQGYYSRRLLAAAGAGHAERELEALELELEARGVRPEALQLVKSTFAEALRRLEEAARLTIARQIRARRRTDPLELAQRPFAQLGAQELDRVSTAVRRLAERLKERLASRDRARSGSLDFRRTLRRNLSWGGVPALLAFRRRRPARPDVVVLCDVSDSVRNVSRMMLLFAHTLQAQCRRVRSFAFVSDLGELTDAFRAVDVRQAVDRAVAEGAVSLWASSDYGKAFGAFARLHLECVGRRTTVLVIGDGRSNYSDPNLEALRAIRRRARRLVWICPEDRRAWGTGDSVMPQYALACDRVAVVRCLADLMRAGDELVPRR